MISAFKRTLGDATLKVLATAFPNAASNTVKSTPLDLSLFGLVRPAGLELLINYGALNVTQLPNGTTTTITIETSADPLFASGVTVQGTQVLTGAAGAGSPAGELRILIASSWPQFVRASFATGVGTGNQAATSADMTLAV
jgi:hypothetical protein